MRPLRLVTDGRIVLAPPRPDDTAALVAGRDDAFRRFIGPGSPDPRPTACIHVGGQVVGWVDYDTDRAWLGPGEVNVGYTVFPAHRGCGYATRAVQLLLHHLAVDTDQQVATLLIHRDNAPSLALAARARFVSRGTIDDSVLFERPVPGLAYGDGVLTLRRRPGDDAFGTGPRWTFAVDAPGAPDIARVDCDLAHPDVPAGEANVAFSPHSGSRGRDRAERIVALALRFLEDHTGAREAHVVDGEGRPRLLSVRSVG